MRPSILQSSALITVLFCAFSETLSAAPATTCTVTVRTDKPVNTFRPNETFGAALDGYEKGDIAAIYTPANIRAMKTAGLVPLTYRLRTELGMEVWHWNPHGHWSNPAGHSGYWISDGDDRGVIALSHGYRLPRRGNTVDQANNDGYSRIDDGDPEAFWKSNPYLDERYTGEPNTAHPQWIALDLGDEHPVNAIRIRWANPYAVRYQIEYWQSNPGDPATSIDSTFDPEGGKWVAFPRGTVTNGHGGDITLRLTDKPIQTQVLRIWMTASSGAPTSNSADPRDAVGYAVREVYAGYLDSSAHLQDYMRHANRNKLQSEVYTSSTDPWHAASNLDPNTEQPGFDLIRKSGLDFGKPVLWPVGVLYDTPENAVAEIHYLKRHGYKIRGIEMGEEPDGERMAPEDYAALYLQWAKALHALDPTLKLGGPCHQTMSVDVPAWPDSSGDCSWTHRFLKYLKSHGALEELGFFSFECYAYDNLCAPTSPQLARAPDLVTAAMRRYRAAGMPGGIPVYMTEYGYSAFAGEPEVDIAGAIFNTDIVARFLAEGGTAAYLYGYEPSPLMNEHSKCDSWGNLALFISDDEHKIRYPLATYYAARLLSQAWAEPGSGTHTVYTVKTNSKGIHGHPLVTAYAIKRPDGRWSILLLNKDPKRVCSAKLAFQNGARLAGLADIWQYSRAQYRWHANKERGYPSPDLPPVHSTLKSPTSVELPPYSITVLQGTLEAGAIHEH